MSRLTRNTVMLVVLMAVDKGLAIVRQVIIARQFSFSTDLDAFNVANNLPDLLFALISGGALALAFIPILTEKLTKKGRGAAWDLVQPDRQPGFSGDGGVGSDRGRTGRSHGALQIGVAPGFSSVQQSCGDRLDAVEPDCHLDLFDQRPGDGRAAGQPAFLAAGAGADVVQSRARFLGRWCFHRTNRTCWPGFNCRRWDWASMVWFTG